MNTLAVARLLSIVGHPALLMPVAVPLAALQRGATAPQTWMAGGAALAVAVIVGLYSLRQVRAGHWTHVDASGSAERLQLNRLLVALLLVAAGLLWFGARSPVLAAGLGSTGAIVLAALGLRRRMKLSLHGAFAAYAAALLWPLWPALAAGAALALAVGWSRLRLQRHTLREVAAGLAVGAVSGLVFNLLAVRVAT